MQYHSHFESFAPLNIEQIYLSPKCYIFIKYGGQTFQNECDSALNDVCVHVCGLIKT